MSLIDDPVPRFGYVVLAGDPSSGAFGPVSRFVDGRSLGVLHLAV